MQYLNTMLPYMCLATTEMAENELNKSEKGGLGSGQSRLSPISKPSSPPKSDYRVDRDRIYGIWYGMIERCHNKECVAYKNYGDRGIYVCSEWKDSFDNFYFWAIKNGYRKDLEIDRMNNDRGYLPSNCRWTTHIINSNNRSDNVKVIINNRTYTLSQLSREYNLDNWVIRKRYKNGDRGERLVRPKRVPITRKRLKCKCGCGETFLKPKYYDKKFIRGHSTSWAVYGERKVSDKWKGEQ